METSSLTIERVHQGLGSREFSAVELATEALRYAEAENPKTNALLILASERALAAARKVDGVMLFPNFPLNDGSATTLVSVIVPGSPSAQASMKITNAASAMFFASSGCSS